MRPASLGGSMLLVAMMGVGPACSVLSTHSQVHEANIESPLDPALAAYYLAAVARGAYPSADPLPQHAGAPVLRVGIDHWRIVFEGSVGGGTRVVMNGRLLAPAQPRLGFDRNSIEQPLPPRFVPTDHTGSQVSADHGVWIDVRQESGQTAIRVRAVGDRRARALLQSAASILQLAASFEHATELARAGHWPRAAALIDGIAGSQVPPATGRTPLFAQLHARLQHLAGVIAIALNDLETADLCFERATNLDPHLAAAHHARCRTLLRLARLPAAAHELQMSEGHQATHHAAANMTFLLSLERRQADPKTHELMSQRYFDADDDLAAQNWARLALTSGSADHTTRLRLAASHQRLGHAQDAFEEELLLFADGVRTPELLTRLIERHHARGDPQAGLHLLAMTWPTMSRIAPDQAGRLLTRLVDDIGPATSTRILALRGCDELAKTQLARWRQQDAGDSIAARTLLTSLGRLRSNRASPAEIGLPGIHHGAEPDPAFGAAPGVAPLR